MVLSSQNLEAFPGDNYVIGMRKSARARYAWASVMIVAMIFSFIVDIANLQGLFQNALDPSSSGTDDESNGMLWFTLEVLPWLLATAVSAIYIVVGSASGNCARLYVSRKKKKYYYATIVLVIAIVVFLVIVALFRFGLEVKPTDSSGGGEVDALTGLLMTLLYTGAMFLGALASFIFGYFRKNALAEKLAVEAQKHLEDDRQLYDFAKRSYMNEHSDQTKYENDLKTVNNAIKFHLNKQNESRLKLLMVKNDPAEAKDVIDISEKINTKLSKGLE